VRRSRNRQQRASRAPANHHNIIIIIIMIIIMMTVQDTNQYIANYTNAGKLTPEITDDFKLSGIR